MLVFVGMFIEIMGVLTMVITDNSRYFLVVIMGFIIAMIYNRKV